VPRYDWGWVIVVRCVVGELELVGRVDGQSFYSCPSNMTDSRSWVQFVHSYGFFFLLVKSEIMARQPSYLQVTPRWLFQKDLVV
jgi:hypothetical protein